MPPALRGVVGSGLVRGWSLPSRRDRPPSRLGYVELAGARTRARPFPAAAVAVVVCGGALLAGGRAGALPPGPHPTKLRCERACAGLRAAARGSLVRWSGAHLRKVNA